MGLNEYIAESKTLIGARMSALLRASAERRAPAAESLPLLSERLESFALSGKMLRGALARLGYDLFRPGLGREGAADPIGLAAALELFQAGLLVHDDIMDGDELRRGLPTMHKMLERDEVTANGEDCPSASAAKLGESMAICAGDIYYFIAWEVINTLPREVGSLVSKELVDVCLAQMRDIRLGSCLSFPAIEAILEVYRFKTARYTIYLPLASGALLSGALGPQDADRLLKPVSDNLGILFQLQDDYLGLFGDATTLGKPIGSDIREGKKTPLAILLSNSLSGSDRDWFHGKFGSTAVSDADIHRIRSLAQKSGVVSAVQKMAEELAAKARSGIVALRGAGFSIDEPSLSLLDEFARYSLSRVN